MAKPKDITDLIGILREDSRLTIVCRAGYDSARHPLVWVRCLCGEEKITRLAHVLSGHAKSHGCLKRENHIRHIQGVVARLAPDTVLVCFVAVCQGRAAELKMKKHLVHSAYYRRVAELEALPTDTMRSITLRILRNESYEWIAADYRMHAAEIAWMAKHVIRPKAEKRAGDKALTIKLKDLAIQDIKSVKANLEEQGRDRFWSSELSGAQNRLKTRLGYAWWWATNTDSSMMLTDQESELVRWFRSTADRTFNIRKTERKKRLEARKRKANQAQPTSL